MVRPRYIVVVAAVAVSVLLIVIGFGGIRSPGARSSRTALTFGQANDLALRQLGPGSWSIVNAFGLDLWNGTTETATAGGYPPNCTIRSQPAVPPTELVVPAYRGDLSNGTAVVWILEYFQPTPQTLAAVLVVGGVVIELVTISGPRCSLLPSGLQLAPWSPVDSSVAAQALGRSGAEAFLATDRNGTSLTMSLFAPLVVNGTLTSPSQWVFTYSPCSGLLQGNLTGPTNGPEFFGVVNATSGGVLNATTTTVNCQSSGTVPPPNPPPALFDVFGLSGAGVVLGPGNGGTIASQGCTSRDYCYELTVTFAEQNVSPSDMAISVVNGSSALPSPVPRGYAFLDPSGRVLVYSLGSSASSWTNGTANETTPLTAGDRLMIDMGSVQPAGLGYVLELQGEGPYSTSGETVTLP